MNNTNTTLDISSEINSKNSHTTSHRIASIDRFRGLSLILMALVLLLGICGETFAGWKGH